MGRLTTPQDLAAKYEGRWRQFRRRDAQAWGMLLMWLPANMAVGLLLRWAGEPGRVFTKGFALAYFVTMLITLFRKASLKCPRCERNFYNRVGFRNDFASHCLNCQLPKYSMPVDSIVVPVVVPY